MYIIYTIYIQYIYNIYIDYMQHTWSVRDASPVGKPDSGRHAAQLHQQEPGQQNGEAQLTAHSIHIHHQHLHRNFACTAFTAKVCMDLFHKTYDIAFTHTMSSFTKTAWGAVSHMLLVLTHSISSFAKTAWVDLTHIARKKQLSHTPSAVSSNACQHRLGHSTLQADDQQSHSKTLGFRV